MKKTLKIAALLSIVATSAHAAWSGDDLILAFQKAGSQNVYIDLGSPSTVLSNGNGIAFDLSAGGVSTVLSSNYGSDWYYSGLVSWTAFSIGSSSMTSLVGTETLNTDDNGDVAGAAANFRVKARSIFIAATDGNSTAANFSVGGTTYYASYGPNDDQNSFSVLDSGRWGSTFTRSIAQTYADGDYALNVISATDGSVTKNGYISLQGGTITAVPEPSTYALIGFGALLLIVAYRRKANA